MMLKARNMGIGYGVLSYLLISQLYFQLTGTLPLYQLQWQVTDLPFVIGNALLYATMGLLGALFISLFVQAKKKWIVGSILGLVLGVVLEVAGVFTLLVLFW